MELGVTAHFIMISRAGLGGKAGFSGFMIVKYHKVVKCNILSKPFSRLSCTMKDWKVAHSNLGLGRAKLPTEKNWSRRLTIFIDSLRLRDESKFANQIYNCFQCTARYYY